MRLTSIAPSSELERALQTPTFEALQQKADEATFERRALAVEKERAIAENELANKIELARREKQLIAEEADECPQPRHRSAGRGAARWRPRPRPTRIRVVEGARGEAEQRADRDLSRPAAGQVLLGLAARELAGKLETIEHLNVTPDLLASRARRVPQGARRRRCR